MFDWFEASSNFRYRIYITAYPVKAAAKPGHMYKQMLILQHMQ